MNANQIMVLLDIGVNVTPRFPYVHEINWLLDNQMVIDTREARDKDSRYSLTERGCTFMNALISLPLPVQAWRMPIPDERRT